MYRLNCLVGSFLEEIVKKVFTLNGWIVKPHKVTDEGVDVEARKDKRLVIAECWNWDRKSYPSKERIDSVLGNLDKYPNAEKLLIASHKVDFGAFKKELDKRGVEVILLGTQVEDCDRFHFKLVCSKLLRVLYSVKELFYSEEVKDEEGSVKVEKGLKNILKKSVSRLFLAVKESCSGAKEKILDKLRKDRRRVRCPVCGEVANLLYKELKRDDSYPDRVYSCQNPECRTIWNRDFELRIKKIKEDGI